MESGRRGGPDTNAGTVSQPLGGSRLVTSTLYWRTGAVSELLRVYTSMRWTWRRKRRYLMGRQGQARVGKKGRVGVHHKRRLSMVRVKSPLVYIRRSRFLIFRSLRQRQRRTGTFPLNPHVALYCQYKTPIQNETVLAVPLTYSSSLPPYEVYMPLLNLPIENSRGPASLY